MDNLGLSAEQRNQVEDIIQAIKQYVQGQLNETVEQKNFRKWVQQEGETFDDFLVALRELSKTCYFYNEECTQKNIHDLLIEGLTDSNTYARKRTSHWTEPLLCAVPMKQPNGNQQKFHSQLKLLSTVSHELECLLRSAQGVVQGSTKEGVETFDSSLLGHGICPAICRVCWFPTVSRWLPSGPPHRTGHCQFSYSI